MSMDFFGKTSSTNIDLRDELHKMLYGSLDLTAQGKEVIVRRMTDTPCTGCFNKLTGGTDRPNCPYCDGEGFQFTETVETMYIARGTAPIYKPGVLATGAPMESEYGYLDPNKATAFCEWTVFPNYERYTWPYHKSYDKLYELKVDGDGNTVTPIVKTAKWKMLAVAPIFGDYGRVEYIMLGLEKANN